MAFQYLSPWVIILSYLFRARGKWPFYCLHHNQGIWGKWPKEEAIDSERSREMVFWSPWVITLSYSFRARGEWSSGVETLKYLVWEKWLVSASANGLNVSYLSARKMAVCSNHPNCVWEKWHRNRNDYIVLERNGRSRNPPTGICKFVLKRNWCGMRKVV